MPVARENRIRQLWTHVHTWEEKGEMSAPMKGTKSVKEAERSHSDVYIFLPLIYEKYHLYQCKFRNSKMLPSFPFCSGKRPGGRQGGSGKQRWPQEQVDSNSVGKMAKLSTYSRTLVL